MRYVALLRGINVGKHNRVKMADLKATLKARGLSGVETYLQSGNVLFNCAPEELEDVLSRFQTALTDLGVTSTIIVRSAAEMKEIVSAGPYQAVEVPDAHKLVHFLKLDCEEELPTQTSKGDAGIALQRPREVYTYMIVKEGRPPDMSSLFKKIAGIPSTARNWIVTQELARLLENGG